VKGTARCYEQLREYVETIGLVDCHDHTPAELPACADPIAVVVDGYFTSDMHSACSDADIAVIQDSSLSVEQRWPLLERVWKRTCYTGYAQVTRRLLKRFYGEDELTLEALKRIERKMLKLDDPQVFERILDQAKIVVRLENVLDAQDPGFMKQVVAGTVKVSPRGRLVIPLPAYHRVCDYETVANLTAALGRCITSLDEYLSACRELFEAYKKCGAVAFKDQSAYTRPLTYGNPTRAQAEEVFNWFMADPRRSVSYPDGVRPLDDYLFHQFLRMAREMELPVQIHTGHMAGIRNDVVKTNAAGLTSLLELHRDVRFDLFHANWPYSGELLFLAKNYPNVTIDFCWANIIDPIYCQGMFKQALSCVPHGKIHGYGSDFVGRADRAWAHASIARDNIAIALSEMVEMDYLGLDDAKQVAHDWLFGNANAFFGLGLSP